MPDFPIIDSHLHVWDPSIIDYPWLVHVPSLQRPFLLQDYNQACGKVAVESMVFLQCEADFSQALKEAQWVQGLAKTEPRIKGIVAWAPIEKGNDCASSLDDLAAIPQVKGIRRILQHEEDPEFCLQPDFVQGLQLLPSYGFCFDICIFHHQMSKVIPMVRQCPEVNFILDHIGKPGIKDRIQEPWKTEIRALSELPNVHCKMSGLVVEADMENWTREDLQPYIDHVLECFGFDRLLFGGDWPVVLQAAEYSEWVDTLDSTLAGCSSEELEKLYRGNARSFYKLG